MNKKERFIKKKKIIRQKRDLKRYHDRIERDQILLDKKKKIFEEGPEERYENPFKNYPGRNELCFCGSGKKFKKCHLLQIFK